MQEPETCCPSKRVFNSHTVCKHEKRLHACADCFPVTQFFPKWETYKKLISTAASLLFDIKIIILHVIMIILYSMFQICFRSIQWRKLSTFIYVPFILSYTSTPLHFREEHCTALNSTASLWQLCLQIITYVKTLDNFTELPVLGDIKFLTTFSLWTNECLLQTDRCYVYLISTKIR